MTRIVQIATLLILAATFTPGCGMGQNKPIVTYERDSATVPKMSTADKKGLYTLFPGNDDTPLAAVYLQPGDSFGFQNINGKVMGVFMQRAESNTVPLDGILTTEYVWKYQGDKKP
jgi:hypothetical protein